ncbi:uncharacterized protein N7500_008781 [Penicillium coprophilum]|uniref:uncharacterized protein n=1 Tax=Penicillium coprophilum TaxID=36646 RepID=UPI002391CB41|nr:uncharacterized protein N7500_008781 [Penicillium coprophilum]KAJ5159130.1 hypothetical protein N7500_008781 [Penicillium coprophilum]
MEKVSKEVSIETQNPLRQNAPSPLHADTHKEVAVSPRPNVEHSMNKDSTLEVDNRDCTLEFSDRNCNLELNQFADDKHTEKQVEAGVGASAPATDKNETNASGRQSAADEKQDPESQSVTETVRRQRYRRREWIIAGSVFATVILLVVIIVPSVIFGTRHYKPHYEQPSNPYIA